jgi:hypothetical protein
MLMRTFLAGAAALLLATSVANAAEPITQFHLAPVGVVTTKVVFKAGKIYPMEISGTRTKILRVGSETEDRTLFEDAFSLTSPTDRTCKDAPCHDVTLTARTAETTTLHPLQEFIPEGEVAPNSDQWRHPPFRADHSYTFNYRPKLTGKLVLATSETCSGPIRCSGEGFDVKIYEPQESETSDPCTSASRTAHAAAVNEVRVVAVQPDVQWHKAGAPEDAWEPVCKDTVLQQGDEISCDPDGAVTLQFADNSTVVIKDTTQLKIASFFTEGGVVRTEILLAMGKIAAQVNKSEATKSDFHIKSPTGTASVRGTSFSVFYDPGAKTTTTTVTEGIVDVTPSNPKLKPVQLTAGKEVEVSLKAISPVASIGKAGARAGINRPNALTKVLRVIARGNGPCGIRTPRTNAFAIKPAKRGWAVTVKLVGKRKGISSWDVSAKKVAPRNDLAKRVARRCR